MRFKTFIATAVVVALSLVVAPVVSAGEVVLSNADAVVSCRGGNAGNMSAMIMTVGVWCSAITEVYVVYYLACQVRVLHINTGIEDGDMDIGTTLGYAPGLRGLNLSHTPLLVKIRVIRGINSLS